MVRRDLATQAPADVFHEIIAMRKPFSSIASVAAAFCCLAPASAQLPPYTSLPAPPGDVVQRENVTFSGSRPTDRWNVVVSKRFLGRGGGRSFYQWYIAIYALSRGMWRLRYESPGNGGPLTKVTQANGANMWFPVQEAKIVGSAPLIERRVQMLVVQSHEMAADCGSAAVTIFGTNGGNTARPVATVTNPCDLSVRIGTDGTSLELTGPYYAANAPLCCPTKTHAEAVLRYSEHRWVVSPPYFKVQ
jgi:hypothetical protein